MKLIGNEMDGHIFAFDCWNCPCKGNLVVPKGAGMVFCPEACGALYQLKYPRGRDDPDLICIYPDQKLIDLPLDGEK